MDSPTERLQILSDIMIALRPGVLTALMGGSRAGSTTLQEERPVAILKGK